MRLDPERMNPDRQMDTALKLVMCIMVASGGVGKTFLAQTVEGMANMLGKRIKLASHDRGNGALHDLLPDVHYIAGDPTDDMLRKLVRDYRDFEILVVDVGANPETANYNPVRASYILGDEASRHGAEFMAASPTGSLKVNGLATALKTVEAHKTLELKSHLVRVHQNKAGDFGGTVPAGVPVSDLPYMDTGLVAFRNQHKSSIANLIRTPPEGFELASAHLANWMIEASRSPLMREIFFPNGGELHIADFEIPPPTYYRLDALWQMADDALQANYDLAKQYVDLVNSVEGQGFRDTLAAYRKLTS